MLETGNETKTKGKLPQLCLVTTGLQAKSRSL